jgi:Leucine-rich repeat (LRR) protein
MNTQVTDVSGLGNCSNLHTLNLSYTQVTDVSSLGSCSSLHTLHLEGKESQVKALLDQLTECRRTAVMTLDPTRTVVSQVCDVVQKT